VPPSIDVVEYWKLVLRVDVIFKIYIKNHFVGFSHLGFHEKFFCIVYFWLYVYDILNAIINDKLLTI
jgi:hypothetical protein